MDRIRQGGCRPLIVYFSEYTYYSLVHDCEVSRISVPDENGREFFAIVALEGKGYRERRSEAIQKCLEAMRAGCEPGEVRWK